MATTQPTPVAELDARALTQYMTVIDNLGRVRGADGLFLVVSQSGTEYLVDARDGACECPDFRYRERKCKHIRRVEFATGRRPIPSWVDRQALDESIGEHCEGDVYFDAAEVADR